jgi:hypothetical protein
MDRGFAVSHAHDYIAPTNDYKPAFPLAAHVDTGRAFTPSTIDPPRPQTQKAVTYVTDLHVKDSLTISAPTTNQLKGTTV